MRKPNKIYQLYLELLEKHGPPGNFWPQWCAGKKTLLDREKICLGAILTQRTAWRNADLALVNLKKAGLLSLEKIANLSDWKTLVDLVRPAGFSQVKPKRLFNFCSFVVREYGNLANFMKEDQEIIQKKLLSLSGIGPETADTILLYGLGKLSFVIDEYTKRLVKKRKLAANLSYEFLKDLFEKNLPCDVFVYQDFHTLIIIEQKGPAGSKMKRI